jgi:hypothetical protein
LRDRVSLPPSRFIATGRIQRDGLVDAELTWTFTSPDSDTPVYREVRSPYARRFRQGAILVPRMLALVEVDAPGPLQRRTQTAVHSRRGRLDKVPWRDLPSHTGVVESIFVRDAYLGEHCLPFRMLPPVNTVIPFDGTAMLSVGDGRIDRYPGLEAWWQGAEQIWTDNRRSELRTLGEQLDYIGQLSAQFPTPPYRVAYTASGNTLAAAVITDQDAVIEHKLYWATAATIDEARYLSAILNSPALGEIVAPYQSRGAFGARDFDKYVWYPPIPEYDAANDDHRRLAAAAAVAETFAAAFEIPDAMGFQRARREIREALGAAGVLATIDKALKAILAG